MIALAVLAIRSVILNDNLGTARHGISDCSNFSGEILAFGTLPSLGRLLGLTGINSVYRQKYEDEYVPEKVTSDIGVEIFRDVIVQSPHGISDDYSRGEQRVHR